MALNWHQTEFEVPMHNQMVLAYHRKLVFVVCIYKEVDGKGFFMEVNQLCLYPNDYYTNDKMDWQGDNGHMCYPECYIDWWVDFEEIQPPRTML